MLPCFRALCCKYSFTTDLRELHLMGAPGRVYMSGQVSSPHPHSQILVAVAQSVSVGPLPPGTETDAKVRMYFGLP